MTGNQFLRMSVIIATLLISFKSMAQSTDIYSNPQHLFNQAVDLYSKAKYGSALVIFDKINCEHNLTIQANSRYYASLCAAQLFHIDAKSRFSEFINDYPQHIRVNSAWLELGKLQLADNNYKDALNSFKNVDKYELYGAERDEFFFKQGYAYFKTNDTKQAKDNFSLLIEKPNKYHVPANYYYAHIAYTEQDYATALKYFERISNDATFKDVTNYYIIQIYSQMGRYDELISKSLTLIGKSNDKKNAEMLRLTADAYFHKSNFAEALTYYNRFLETKPSKISRVDNYNIGVSCVKTSDFAKAINFLQTASNAQDTLAQYAYLHLGDCYIKTNQKRFAYNAYSSAYKLKLEPVITEEALFNYTKLAIDLSYNPYNEAVLAVQDYLDKYPNSVRRDEAYSYLTDLYLLTKNYKNAYASLQQVKKRNSNLEAAYQRISYFRGIELFNENNFDEAIKLFETARELKNDNGIRIDAAFWIGEAYYRTARWNQAIEAFNRFYTTPGVNSSTNYNTANYSQGYAYFKNKNYTKAIVSFQKYVQNTKNDVRLLADSYLRLGDSYFMTKDYQQAINNYQKSISLIIPDADYAMYQTALSYGVLSNFQSKIDNLQKLIKSYPKSNYNDDALFEIGLTYNVLNRDNEALTYYQRVVKEYPKSPYVKKSLLKTGLIYFNQDKNEEALEQLKQVAKDHPGTPESQEALASIKSIYTEMSDIEQYVEFTKQVPSGNISTSEQDSLTYIGAENQYMNGNCEKAIESFNKYIKRFPEGSFILAAHFYAAECEFRSQQLGNALIHYKYILDHPRSRFTANSAWRTARIYHQQNNFESALESYIRLEETAEKPDYLNDAIVGQMQCNYQMKRYGLAIQSAQKILSTNNNLDNQAIEAHLIIARSAYYLGNIEQANREYAETKKLSRNEMGAEAAYMLAQILYERNKYDECEKAIFAISESYASYDYWVAKSFILLSDVYVKKDNVFQARQTLQSIIDNYEGQDLVMIAREKLNALPTKD